MIDPNLILLAQTTAQKYGLPPELVCAVIEQESAWDTRALRFEPAFFGKYVAPLYTNMRITATEAYARGFSWGLMQVMGQVARENGFDGKFLSQLCEPVYGVELGCRVLRRKLDGAQGDATLGLLAWNGGANKDYPKEVLARQDKYPPAIILAQKAVAPPQTA